jgi:hypothetical protein
MDVLCYFQQWIERRKKNLATPFAVRSGVGQHAFIDAKAGQKPHAIL